MALPTPGPTSAPPKITFESKGREVYEVGCLNNNIWNKNFIKDRFIWELISFKGDTLSIGAYANDFPVVIYIKLNDVIVESLTIEPKSYGSITYQV